MKVLAVIAHALAVLALQPLAWGQQVISPEPKQVDSDRLRIEQQRQTATVELNAQAQACQSSFFVTSCLQDVSRRRIAMISELKRQEAALNDAERQKRGAEQLVRSAEKLTERAKSDADLSTLTTPSQFDREMAQENKKSQHNGTASQSVGRASMPKAPVSPVMPDIQNNRKINSQRVEEANERRASRDKRLQERARVVAPLPVLP